MNNLQLAKSVGEFTVVVAPSIDPGKAAQSDLVNAEQLATLVGCLTDHVGVDSETALSMGARAFVLTPRKAASMLKRRAYSVKRQSDSAP